MDRRDSLIAKFKKHANALKGEAYALYIAARDPRVPWYAKVFMGLVLAYAFSPIDLIPDFIPVLGYLDDLVIIPLGIALSLKMIPAEVMSDARKQAKELSREGNPVSRLGAVLIILIWLTLLAVVIWLIVRRSIKSAG
jgi:uncharacterized membrane protein YkvA (DUF1232 family)